VSWGPQYTTVFEVAPAFDRVLTHMKRALEHFKQHLHRPDELKRNAPGWQDFQLYCKGQVAQILPKWIVPSYTVEK
jgi:hypothetical protein